MWLPLFLAEPTLACGKKVCLRFLRCSVGLCIFIEALPFSVVTTGKLIGVRMLTNFLQSFFGNLENKFLSEKSGSGYSSAFPKTSPTHLDWPLHDFLISEIKSIFSEDIQIKSYGL